MNIDEILEKLKYELIGLQDGWLKPNRQLLKIYYLLLKRYGKK